MDEITKVKNLQSEVSKNQVTIQELESKIKLLEQRTTNLEAFKDATIENVNRIDAVVSMLRKKMNEQIYMTHKLRIEQYAIKRNIKQLDFSMSQIPYLMVDELHEQDLQRHYLILRDCTTYNGFPFKDNQPDFRTYAISVIREIWDKFDGRKLVHCEFIKPNAWEKKQVPTHFRLKLKFNDQITPMTVRNIAISKKVYRYRMGQTKRRRNYRYKKVQEAEEKNKVLPRDSTWEYRVVQGTRIAKVDKKTGDFLQGQYLDEQMDKNFENNRVKDFRLNIQLYEGINPNVKPVVHRIDDSEDEDDYSRMEVDSEDQDQDIDSVVQIFTDDLTQQQNKTSFRFDPLQHNSSGNHEDSNKESNDESINSINSNESTVVNSMRSRELLIDPTQDEFSAIEGAASTPSHFNTQSQDSDKFSTSSGYSSLKSDDIPVITQESHDDDNEDSETIELETTPIPTKKPRKTRTKKPTEMEKSMNQISKFGFTTASSHEDIVKDKKKPTTKKRKLEDSKLNETTLPKEGRISKDKPKHKPPEPKIQKIDSSKKSGQTTGGFDPSNFVPQRTTRRTTKNNQDQGNSKGPQSGASAKSATKIIMEKVTKGPSAKESKATKSKKQN